jgi:hypothetical protein
MRRWAYLNTHKLYTYHSSLRLGFRDLVLGFFFELMRSIGVFVASPTVWFLATRDCVMTFPEALRRRQKMKRMGLKYVRFLA